MKLNLNSNSNFLSDATEAHRIHLHGRGFLSVGAATADVGVETGVFLPPLGCGGAVLTERICRLGDSFSAPGPTDCERAVEVWQTEN